MHLKPPENSCSWYNKYNTNRFLGLPRKYQALGHNSALASSGAIMTSGLVFPGEDRQSGQYYYIIGWIGIGWIGIGWIGIGWTGIGWIGIGWIGIGWIGIGIGWMDWYWMDG